MASEAAGKFPDETGGVLIGYWINSRSAAVITRAIGPGPKAIHEPRFFLPDDEYQEAQIESIYRRSRRLHTYLGDWHTHPNESSYLSQIDRQTMGKIASYTEARTPYPLMAVLGGGPKWTIRVWRYRRLHLIKKINIPLREVEMKVQIFETL